MSSITAAAEIVTLHELHCAFQRVAENNGAAGADGISIEDFHVSKERYLSQLLIDLNKGNWKPKPYLAVTIPKKSGGERGLAIPCVKDRIVHTWLAQKISPILEKQFARSSYGYRPHRSYMDAIQRVEFLRDSGYGWVVDADIKAFFDNIHHRLLQEKIIQALPNSSLCELIHQAITAQQQEHHGELSFGANIGVGIPQGSPLSPLLANLFLNELDTTMLDSGFEIVRYADDFIVHCKTEQGALLALDEVTQVLKKNQLELNHDKTRITNFELGFNFLGVNFIDQLTLAESLHTDRCWHNLKPTSKSTPEIDNELNLTATPPKHYWLDNVPSSLLHLTDCIEDDLEPQQPIVEQTRVSISQIAKLRTLYVQKQGAVISMRNGQFRVSYKGEELQRFPAATIDTLWLFGNVHPTIAVTKHCLTHSIPMILLSQAGQRCGALGFEAENNPELLRTQALEQSDPEQCLKQIRFLIGQKLNNQLQLLKRWSKQGLPLDQTAINGVMNARNSVAECDSIEQLRGYEGIGAKFYFQQWKIWCQHTWQFTGRNRRPPKDPINVLLSFGYQLLFNNIEIMLETRGLSPLFGYLHKQANGFPSLALDLMEPWRPIVVDEVVMKLVLRQTIKPSDFMQTEQGCLFLDRGKKTFVQAFEQRMQQRFTHPELKIKTDLRRFIDLQVLELRQLLLTNEGSLTPLRLR